MTRARLNLDMQQKTRLTSELRALVRREEAVVDLRYPAISIRGNPPDLVIPDYSYDHEALRVAVGTAPQSVANRIAALSRQVCRIDRQLASGDTTQLGTGFLVAPDVIATCRHVVAAFARKPGPLWKMKNGVGAKALFSSMPDFEPNTGIGVKEILFAGSSTTIGDLPLDKNEPEIALLRLASSVDLPIAGAMIDWTTDIEGTDHVGRAVAVVSFPGNPFSLDASGNRRFSDPKLSGIPISMVTSQFEDSEGELYGTCCATIGTLSDQQFANDDHRLFAGHTCSTLGGSSGAPVYDITTNTVIGMHCGGIFGVTNHIQFLHAATNRIGEGDKLAAVLRLEGILP